MSSVRPDLAGPVLWMLAGSRQEVTDADGLPDRLRSELSRMLDGWYGDAAAAVVDAAAQSVETLTRLGGPGALRVLGSAQVLLVELVSRTEPAEPVHGVGPWSRTGCYRTLGELGSHHVRWATVLLPDDSARADLPAAAPASDVWT